MRRTIFLVPLLTVLASALGAQPKCGDLVFGVGDGYYGYQRGYTAYLNPSSPGTLTTLAAAPAGSFHDWVRMAPNNTDLVVTRADFTTNPVSGDLVHLQLNGTQSTLARFPTFSTDGHELDHDGKWILSGRRVYWNNPGLRQNFVFGVDHVSGRITIFTSLQASTWFNEVAIDREPGSMPYVNVACCQSASTGPEVLKSDRLGTVTTLVSGSIIPPNTAIELHPRTGDYIIGSVNNGHIIRMNQRTGSKTTLTTFSGNAIKIMPDDTAWIANGGWSIRTVLRYDLSQNAVLTIFPSGLPFGWNLMGIDVYGSRTLVCNQKSPATVGVNVQSRLPSIKGGEQYVLAASFARRPGLKMANGEWLHLNTASDPLFFLTALNLLPGVFENFRGVLDPFGNNDSNKPITVQIPPPLRRSGITVFVAGVIFNQTGVLQATNTHWFVM